MKLLLIQGNYIARYIGRKQDCVFLIDWKHSDVNPSFIEKVRTGEINA